MSDRMTSFILIALQLIAAIITFRTAILNKRITSFKEARTIAINPKQKTSLFSTLFLMLFCVVPTTMVIWDLFDRSSQYGIISLISVLGLMFSSFMVGTHAGLWMWAEVIIKPIDEFSYTMVVKNTVLRDLKIEKIPPPQDETPREEKPNSETPAP